MSRGTRIDTSEWDKYVVRYLQDTREETVRTIEQAAQEIRNQAIDRSPVVSGALRAGWQVGSERFSDKATVVIYNPVPYVAHVEYGTKSRRIEPRTPGGVLRFMGANGQAVFAKFVNHPGTRPRPMIRPAIDKVLPVLRRKLGG